MSEISSIEPQKSARGRSASGGTKKGRFNIYIDGGFAFGLSGNDLADARLKIGQKISQQEIDQLVKLSDFGKIFDKVLNFLSYRPRSQKEIKDYLKKQKTGTEVEKQIFEKLEKLNFISDLEFANWWIENRLKFRPKGTIALKAELLKKGISREIIDQTLFKISNQDQQELALKTARKQINRWQNLPTEKLYQKMVGFLARRGFSWEIIKSTIDTITQKR